VRLIAVSQDAASAAAGALAISPERIRVIRNGIDLELFPFNPRRAFPGSSSAPCLVQIGRLDDPKGHSVALAAFPRVLEAFPEARLLFVGDGPLRTRLESQTRALGLDGRVRFLGVRSDIPALLEASDLFWMPSRWEGLPIACLEAMACGLPTVTTDVVGLREVAVDGVTGFVAPPDSPELLAQASLRILKDPALAQRMGLAGRQRVEEKFSIERTADEYARAYEDIMQGRWK
jgi:glycosyltransferase involved in cell wall biosynthesis